MIFLMDFRGDWLARRFQAARRALGLDLATPYFNAGLMTIDRARWRELKITERVVDALVADPERFPFMEQDALNSILRGNFAPLSPRFNFMGDFFLLDLEREIAADRAALRQFAKALGARVVARRSAFRRELPGLVRALAVAGAFRGAGSAFMAQDPAKTHAGEKAFPRGAQGFSRAPKLRGSVSLSGGNGSRFLGSASKLFANFFQAFSKPFANFRGFSPSFSKFLFGGFGEYHRVGRHKVWRAVPFRFTPNFYPCRGRNFLRAKGRRPRAEADEGEDLTCQTTENHSTVYSEKQNIYCDFFVETSAADPCAEAGALSAMGRKESR